MPDKDKAALPFEEALKKLETIVRKLESGEVGLEESIRLYEEGNKLKELCDAKLADAQLRVKKITLADGKPSTQKFDKD